MRHMLPWPNPPCSQTRRNSCTAGVVVGIAAQHAERADIARFPERVFAHDWEGLLVGQETPSRELPRLIAR